MPKTDTKCWTSCVVFHFNNSFIQNKNDTTNMLYRFLKSVIKSNILSVIILGT